MAATMDKPRRSGSEDKLLGIELLRFASALAVLVFHYQHLAFVGTQQVNFEPTQQPFYSLLSFFYRYGFHGVQVFAAFLEERGVEAGDVHGRVESGEK